VQIREKGRAERAERAERYDLRWRFWSGLLERAKARTDLHANISPKEYHWIGASSGLRGLSYNYVITQHEGSAELYVDRGPGEEEETKAMFDRLHQARAEVEVVFGGPLDWQRLEGRRACRIRSAVPGGYRDDETKWPAVQDAMIDAMVRLEKALAPQVAKVRIGS
jgi:hypothetical protein